MTLFERNLPQKQQRTRERERTKKNERAKARERGREQQKNTAGWMPNDMGTAGNRAPQVEFPSSVFARSVNVHNSLFYEKK